jgi:hypothetical protein
MSYVRKGAAAVVAVAAPEGPRNSTAATPGAPAPEMGALARPGNDGKAYQHVWPVTQTTLVLTICLLQIMARFCNIWLR